MEHPRILFWHRKDLRIIGFLQRMLAEQHLDGQIIIFIDELENCEFWDPVKDDWNEISSTSKVALILVFNPGTSEVNSVILDSWMNMGRVFGVSENKSCMCKGSQSRDSIAGRSNNTFVDNDILAPIALNSSYLKGKLHFRIF